MANADIAYGAAALTPWTTSRRFSIPTVDVLASNGYEVSSRAYWAAFNSGETTSRRLFRALQHERVVSAAAQTPAGRNVLLLDEPSNDLTSRPLRARGGPCWSFSGCALVSFPRPLVLDRIATTSLAFEYDPHGVFRRATTPSNEADHKKRVGDDTPHRMKYKRIDA
ncbi:hypothetical protein DSL92_01190 [Billgrantia gudaonensis]|uniref:Uncharacterized protein n=1 Tax=Billgrantia gudaonensis TaxID=376427 RepID=A0A432JKI5_9GAMM|nr:hypothetical protein DSL92_01190 [Halomonas gudaonensis]